MREFFATSKGKIAAAAVGILLVAGIILLATAGARASNAPRDIGSEKALAAALSHAEVKESDVELTKSKKDSDDGRIVYEFDFIKGDTKFEYQVDGATGSIDEFSKEVIASSRSEAAKPDADQPAPPVTDAPKASADSTSSGPEYIGVDSAKSIALKDAGLKASDVTFSRAKMDRDDGRAVYEIDFYSADWEYDYEIDAADGRILDRDSEPLDDWDDDDRWDD